MLQFQYENEETLQNFRKCLTKVKSASILNKWRIVKKIILISAVVALILGASNLLASAEYSKSLNKSSMHIDNNNKDDIDERYKVPYLNDKDGLNQIDDEYDERYETSNRDEADEHYEISNIYNGHEHYSYHNSDDEYDEHF